MPQPTTTFPFSRICMLPSLEHGRWKLGRYSLTSWTSILSVSSSRMSPRASCAVTRYWFAAFEKSVTRKGDDRPEPCSRAWCWKWKSVLRANAGQDALSGKVARSCTHFSPILKLLLSPPRRHRISPVSREM